MPSCRPLLRATLGFTLSALVPALHAQHAAVERCSTPPATVPGPARTTPFTTEWKTVSCLAAGPHEAELRYSAPAGWEIDQVRIEASTFLDLTQTPPSTSERGKTARGAVACKQVMSRAEESLPHNNDLTQPGRVRLVGVLVESRQTDAKPSEAPRACEEGAAP